MKPMLLCLVLGLVPILAQSPEPDPDLKLVHVFFRHGSRTPEKKDMYPNDIYTIEDFTPVGWGQLTNVGKQRAYKLGKMLRDKYNTFLGELYTPEIVEAISTDYDRTKMSTLLVLAGLFPPSPAQKWDEELNWLPIPYQFEKEKHDYFIRRPNHYCPAYNKSLAEEAQSDLQKNITRQFEDVFEYISESSGKVVKSVGDVFGIYQTLNAEENMNLTLPDWTKTVYPEPISTIAGLQCQLENATPLLKRLNGGRSLKKVIQHMQQLIGSTLDPSGRRIYLYSGHENNVINILAALNLFTPHVPKYSAAVIIELLQDSKSGQYFVKVFYAKEVGEPPIQQRVGKCELQCPFDKFLEYIKESIPENYTKECQAAENLGD